MAAKNITSKTKQKQLKPAEFNSFDKETSAKCAKKQNLNMLMDINIQLTAELGKCELPIKQVLELTKDSIIQLDKTAGEPISLYANGKHIADGEVVISDDNYAVKITKIAEKIS